MQINQIEIMLLSLFFVLIVIRIITIINYNYSNNYLSTLYILAELDDNNNNNNENNDGKEDTKKKDKKKDRKEGTDEEKKNNKNKEEKSSDSLTYDNNNWTRTDQDLITKYNYRNLAIPKIYQNAPDGETYRFNKTNPNDKVQVDEGENKKVFTKQNKDGSWRIDFGKPSDFNSSR